MTERYYPYIIVGGGLTGAPALWMKFDSSMPQVQYSLSVRSTMRVWPTTVVEDTLDGAKRVEDIFGSRSIAHKCLALFRPALRRLSKGLGADPVEDGL